jgi:hypothetical protein
VAKSTLTISAQEQLKLKFPNISFDFDNFQYGVPKSHPFYDRLRYNPETRKKRTLREKKDPELVEKKRLKAKEYYSKEKENILQRAKDRYRSDVKIGTTGKTLKELTKEKNIKDLIKFQKEKGVFPSGYTTSGGKGFFKPELALWSNLYRAGKDGTGRWTLPKKFIDNVPINDKGNKSWAQNNYYKKIKFVDNNTGETIKLDETIKGKGKTLKEYLNTTIAKESGKKNVFEESLKSYQLKDKLKDTKIVYRGQEETLGGILRRIGTEKTGDKVISPFEVHHPSGVKNNWWDSEVVFRDANRNLNYINSKLERAYKNAKDKKTGDAILKTFAKEVDKQPGGITYFFEGKQVGTKVPTEESILKGITQTYKDPALTRAINILINKTKSVRGGCAAVVTAALGGPIDTCEAVIRANPKAAAMKLNNAITATKGPLKDLKETSKDVAKLIDTGQVTTADKLPRPDDAIRRDMFKETNIRWNNDIGAFVTPNEDIASQADIKKYIAENPMEVKAGETPLKPATNKSVLANVGRTMAAVGAPLPTALIDSYFIGQQVKQGKGTAEIASNPLNWLGLATMEPLTKAAGIAEGDGLKKVLRLGLNPATIRGISRFAGLPGLAISTAMTAYDQYEKYKDGEGFIYKLFNKEGT